MNNIGIYCLNFDGICYVGKSNNLSRRYRDHLTSMLEGTANYKVMDAYKRCGAPEFLVLEYCTVADLNTREIYWIKELDSVNTGLNISSGGDGGGSGTQHNRAIYSEEILIEVFKLLSNSEVYTYQEISDITGVSISTITNIVDNNAHAWLQERYPELFNKIRDRHTIDLRYKKSRKNMAKELSINKSNGFLYPDLINPSGTVYTNIINAREFSEKHGLTREGLSRLFSKKIKSHRGWKLYNKGK